MIEADPLHRSRLLIVDDDAAAVQIARRILSAYDDVRFALSGEDALRLAAEAPPDLVLLDEEMPGMSGLEVCRAFQADERLREVPIVFLTARSEGAMELLALDSGAVDFLTKPVVPALVTARVRAQLRLRQLAKAQHQLTGELELALSAGRLGAWQWDIQQGEMRWHESMTALRGQSAATIRRFQDHLVELSDEDQKAVRQAAESSLRGEKDVQVEYQLRVGNDLRQIRLRITAMHDSLGLVERLLGVEQDITDWRRSTAQLQSANRQLEQFVSFASHDLRAPVRQMSSFAALVRRKMERGQVADVPSLLDEIESAGVRLQDLTRSFLDLARHRVAEPGEWRLVDMSQLVSQVAADLAELARERDTVITVLPMAEAYAPVNLIAHVWRNLIANAIRHQKAEQRAVRAGETTLDGRKAYYVEDNGTQRFSLDLDGASHPRREGPTAGEAGLGLDICRKVVRVLGGQMRLLSDGQHPNRIVFTFGDTAESEQATSRGAPNR